MLSVWSDCVLPSRTTILLLYNLSLLRTNILNSATSWPLLPNNPSIPYEGLELFITLLLLSITTARLWTLYTCKWPLILLTTKELYVTISH